MGKKCLISAILASAFALGAGAQPLFRSDRLEKMAAAMALERLDTLRDGEHYAALRYGGLPVTIIVRSGTVEHIGYSFLTPSMRAGVGPVVSSFIERYALEADLQLRREKDVPTQLMEDDVFFSEGSLSSLKTFCADTTMMFRIDLVGNRRYRITWPGGDMLFPADHELLLGRSLTENIRRLPEEISSCPAATHPAEVAGDSFYLEDLKSCFYHDRKGKAIDDPRHPVETIANMLGGFIPAGNLSANVKMNSYDLTFSYFEVPLQRIVSYGIHTGCAPYFGIIEEDDDTLECELILRQVEAGYVHAIRLWVPRGILASKDGQVQMRLTPFIPMHNLKYMFVETMQ